MRRHDTTTLTTTGRQCMALLRRTFPLLLAVAAAGCTADSPEAPARHGADCRMVLSVDLAGTGGAGAGTRAPGDNHFADMDAALQKYQWGQKGENIERLRIIIVDDKGMVEHNEVYDERNATESKMYEFEVSESDKTVIFVANEQDYVLDEPGMEIPGGTMSLTGLLDTYPAGGDIDLGRLEALTLALRHNSLTADADRQSLRTPLPITAIHHMEWPEGVTTVERKYDICRAAVKYSFRIINLSKWDHKLEGMRIDRIADREYLFPHATFAEEDEGYSIITDYDTPPTAAEQEYAFSFETPVKLPKGMTEPIEVVEPIYVPEGLKSADEAAQRVSLTLDGAPLDMWRDLEWRYPGEAEAKKRPMADLPRGTHVVIDITIRDDNSLDFVADIQPYAGVTLEPWYGLDRDGDGNIIVNRYDDGSYDVLDHGETVRKDQDGDILLKQFADGTWLCEERVYKDYIHDNSEVDYVYRFEKDAPGGNMIIIRQESLGGTFTEGDIPIDNHEHGTDDRPLFVLDKKGDFQYVTYEDGVAKYSPNDRKGDPIVQANGFQFRDTPDFHKYIGTYVVEVTRDGKTEQELRYYKDGTELDWDLGIDDPVIKGGKSLRPAGRRARAAGAAGRMTLRQMRRASAEATRRFGY